jgi:hypothetical protein
VDDGSTSCAEVVFDGGTGRHHRLPGRCRRWYATSFDALIHREVPRHREGAAGPLLKKSQWQVLTKTGSPSTVTRTWPQPH